MRSTPLTSTDPIIPSALPPLAASRHKRTRRDCCNWPCDSSGNSGLPMRPLLVFALSSLLLISAGGDVRIFNVRDYGATGKKADDARGAIQKAVDACARAGGGMVYLPPGAYTSGTIHLRSYVRFHIEAGATLFASQDPAAFDKAGLLYGEDLENITIEGRGTVDGQAEYVWRKNTQHYNAIEINRILAERRGNAMMRPYPKGWPDRETYPHMVLLLRCKDIRITGLSFLNSPSWTINPYACVRLTIDGVYIRSSLKEG